MTIFDVLRYPISEPPTEEELDRLPRDLLECWKSNNGFMWSTDTEMISNFYMTSFRNKEYLGKCKKEINELRRMVKEYDDNL